MREFLNRDVEAAYLAWPSKLRSKIVFLREMVFGVAANTDGVGTLEETLKWNVPAYLTVHPKSGTTIRLQADSENNSYGLYVPCSTSLIEQCRELYADVFSYTKNRGIVFNLQDKVPKTELRHFIAMALTYHVKSAPTK